MPSSLLYIVICVAIAAYLLGVARRRRAFLQGLPEGVRGVRRGPVPGYSYLPGSGIRWDPVDLPGGLGDRWKPLALETLHAGRRMRLVLTLRSDDEAPTDLFSTMRSLARRLLQRSGAHVVAVRVVPKAFDEVARATLVLAPDGGGWTGTGRGAAVTAELPDRQPFRTP